MTGLTRRLVLASGLGLTAPTLAAPALAQPRRTIRFMLDWTPLAHHASWFLAADRGYFAREGMEVQIQRGFLRATLAGLKDALLDPAAGVAAIKAREPLTDATIELERFLFTMRDVVLTPAVAQHGVGVVDPTRAQAMVGLMAEAFGESNPPAASSFMLTQFLPPMAARMLPTMRA